MKLPSFKRLFSSDYETEDQPLVNKLSASINDGFENIFNALNRRLTLQENIACTVRSIPITVNANGTPQTPSFIKLDIPLPVVGVSVIDARNQANTNIYPTSQPFITWQLTNSGLQIVNITGLQDNQPYIIKVKIEN